MIYRRWLPSKQEWYTSGYYDLADIAMLHVINVESIAMLQWTKLGKVSEEPRWLATLIIGSMEALAAYPPTRVSS